MFASALRILRADAEWLQSKLVEAAANADAASGEGDAYTQRFTLDFECVRGERRARIRSCWIVRTGEDFPRLTSCFIV